ncbi:glycosyltransferase family 2 protein [Polaribacter sp. 11A2H]|uniref:glycosyltransferase family 2 protein n=1 Tax=Polaribacter sp. 11A2H TaxID=2687290 RepID=UPI00140A2524|nr:glycosyltransferase family 2 protein [Polaribacter sp. 11A2H]
MLPDLAPIVFFAYNRPDHTRKSLLALSENTLAPDSKLYIFCDGTPKGTSEENIKNNNLVKAVLREKKWCGTVEIVESSFNKGLAKSVIEGVGSIVEKYGKVIVLEDDLITSRYFLEYMNSSLNKYEKNKSVVQISGFSFPSPKLQNNQGSFFLPITSTWGWATWGREWESLDFNCRDYIELKQDKEMRYNFNFNGSYNYTKMFFQQMESNKISSWGIRFYWNAFKRNGKILYPDKSLVYNNGWDGTGKHNDSYEIFPMPDWDKDFKVKNFPDIVKFDDEKVNIITKYMKSRTSIYFKIFIKIKSIFNI